MKKKFGKKILSAVCLASVALNIPFNVVSAEAKTPAKTEKTTYTVYTNGVYADYPLDGGKAKSIVLAKAAKDGITGIDFKITFVESSDYASKLNILAASNKLPDVFSIDHTLEANFQQQKLLLNLNPYVSKYIPNLAKLGRKTEIDSYKIDGNLYALPSVYLDSPYSSPNVDCYILREDWLDNLKLKMPNKISELETVLKAFKNNDPDKNGKNDTIPLAASKTTRFQGILGAYGIVPGFWAERNGKLQHGTTLPEMKDALTTLQKWYKEGLIDKDYLTADNDLAYQKYQSGKAGMIYSNIFELDPTSIINQALLKQVPTAKPAALAAPAGPKGLRGYPESAPGSRVVAMSAKIKNPELMSKYINWIIDPTDKGGQMLVTYGEAGKDYVLDTTTDVIKQKTSNPELVKVGFSNPIRWISVIDRRWMSEAARDNIPVASKYALVNQFWGKTQDIIDHPEIFNLEIFDEYLAKIVTGTLPVSAYDEYLKKFDNLGGKEATEKVNEIWQNNK